MSMYNLMHGVSPYAFLAIPMLFDQHPDDLPRFRDCFSSAVDKPDYTSHIFVYTRVGSVNQGEGYGEELYTKHPDFVEVFDGADNTYGMYVFKVPEKWKADNDLIMQGRFKETSEEYKQKVIGRFPKLNTMLKSLFYEDMVQN